MKHELPDLGYAYNELEPYIDKKTMKIHHKKHHQTYVDKLNKALVNYKDLQRLPVDDLIRDLNAIPKIIRSAVRNHGGGHSNHTLFWQILKKDVKIGGEIEKAIEQAFGDFNTFKQMFSDAAASVFGSGWAWLVYNKGKIEIITTQNQDSPLSQEMLPLLALDVWEHAYYLKYQNQRPAYIDAFFNVINWGQVNENLSEANKGS